MPSVEESVCCQEVDKVRIAASEGPSEPQCITLHEGFSQTCLAPYALKVACTHYRQQHGQMEEGDNNARLRYAAYRQFVRWCWGYLGRHIRVPLPACVVRRIQQEFPEADYVGFLPVLQ